jgi:hypothetical protein
VNLHPDLKNYRLVMVKMLEMNYVMALKNSVKADFEKAKLHGKVATAKAMNFQIVAKGAVETVNNYVKEVVLEKSSARYWMVTDTKVLIRWEYHHVDTHHFLAVAELCSEVDSHFGDFYPHLNTAAEQELLEVYVLRKIAVHAVAAFVAHVPFVFVAHAVAAFAAHVPFVLGHHEQAVVSWCIH